MREHLINSFDRIYIYDLHGNSKKKETDINGGKDENVGELQYACNENRLIKLKGFGVKSQEEIKKSVEFLFANKDKYHYAYAAFFANEFIQLINQLFPDALISFTGELYRKTEVV